MGNRYGTLYFFKIPSNGIPSLVFRFALNGRDIRFPSNEIFSFFLLFLSLFFSLFVHVESSRLRRSKLVEFWIRRSSVGWREDEGYRDSLL